MSRKYFGTDGIRGRVGEFPITPEFMLKLGWAAGMAFRRQGALQGVDRQGHADFRLHVRIGPAGRSGRCRRRCDAARSDADSGDRLPDPHLSCRCGYRHQCLAQSARRQRHQVLLRPGHQAAGRGRGNDRRAARSADDRGRVGADRQGFARSTMPRGAISSSARAACRPVPIWPVSSWCSIAPTVLPTRWRPACSASWVPRWR